MELNEMKGIHNVSYDEAPFHHNLQNPSLIEKSQPSILHTKMIKQQDQNQDHQNHHPFESFPLDHYNHLMINNKSSIFSNNTNTSSCNYSNNDDTVFDDDDNEMNRNHVNVNVIAERKLRRMISNRESARRSRMRKKKQIEELQYQVSLLEASNRQLSEKLLQLLECNQQILHENAELKHKVSSLQIILTDFLTPLRNLEDVFCSSNNRIRATDQASNSSHHLQS